MEVILNSGSPFGFKHFTKDTVNAAHLIDSKDTITGIIDLTEFANVWSMNDLTVQYNSDNVRIVLPNGQAVKFDNYGGAGKGAFTTQVTTGFTYYTWARLDIDSKNFKFYTGTLEGDRAGNNINDVLEGYRD